MAPLPEHPARSRQVEAILTERLGNDWDFRPDIGFTAVKPRAKSDFNQARIETRLMGDYVRQLTRLLTNGTVLPAVIVRRRDMTLLDGYHRYTAHKGAGMTTISVYAIQAADEFLEDQLIVELNQSAGKRLTQQEQQAKAEQYIKRGISEQRVADLVQVPLSTLRQWSAYAKVSERLNGIGETVDMTAWPKTAAVQLNSLRNTPTLLGAARLTTDARLKSQEVADLVKNLRQANSQGEEQELLREERETLGPRIQAMASALNGNGKAQAFTRPVWMQSLPALALLTKYEAERYVASAPEDQVVRIRVLWQRLSNTATEALRLLEAR